MTKQEYEAIERYYSYIRTHSDRGPQDEMIVRLVEELQSYHGYILELEKALGIDKYLEKLKGLEK